MTLSPLTPTQAPPPRRSVFPYLFNFAIAFFVVSTFGVISPTLHAQDDEDVVRVEAELVLLNATVTDSAGHFVHRMTRKDFKIFEDSTEQSINIFAREENPFAAAILIDTSGSMGSRITLARAAAIRFLEKLRPDDVAALYHFDRKVERLQEFNNSRDLPSLAYDLRAEGTTKLHDAIRDAARDLARRPETRRAILVLSDGVDTASTTTLDKALNEALAANATVYTVNMADISLSGNQRQMLAGSLKKLAEKSGGRYVETPGGKSLQEAFEGIIEELSNQYTLGYRPTNRMRDGKWRSIKLEITNKDHKVRTRAGYKALKQ